MMYHREVEGIISLLESGNFESLIGKPEDLFFECKGSSYQLEQDREKLELAKDVSAFANAQVREDSIHGESRGKSRN